MKLYFVFALFTFPIDKKKKMQYTKVKENTPF